MREVSLSIPDFVEINTGDLKMMLAVDLYKNGSVSIGQAAEVAGVSKRTFIETMGNFGATVFNYTAEEVERDFKNA
jgi:predicted HTH domain antitoxin